MKFLVLALCVCAASAATLPNVYKPWQSKAFAQAVVRPVVQPTALPVVKAEVQPVPQPIVKSVVPAGSAATAGILRFASEVNPDSFNFGYETENGINAQASGAMKTVDNVDVLTVQGAYGYVAPDGTPVQLTYVADENGYQPKSNILPVGPAIPEYIIRALEYIRTHPSKEELAKKF